jgi:hypothetical protein
MREKSLLSYKARPGQELKGHEGVEMNDNF